MCYLQMKHFCYFYFCTHSRCGVGGDDSGGGDGGGGGVCVYVCVCVCVFVPDFKRVYRFIMELVSFSPLLFKLFKVLSIFLLLVPFISTALRAPSPLKCDMVCVCRGAFLFQTEVPFLISSSLQRACFKELLNPNHPAINAFMKPECQETCSKLQKRGRNGGVPFHIYKCNSEQAEHEDHKFIGVGNFRIFGGGGGGGKV